MPQMLGYAALIAVALAGCALLAFLFWLHPDPRCGPKKNWEQAPSGNFAPRRVFGSGDWDDA